MRKLLLGMVAAAAIPLAVLAAPAASAGPEPGRAASSAFRWVGPPPGPETRNPSGIAAARPDPSRFAMTLAPALPAASIESLRFPQETPPGAVEASAQSLHFFHDEYVAVRAGPYWGAGSKNDLTTAFYGEIELGHQIDDHAILLFQVGVLDGDRSRGGVKTEVNAVPIMVGGTAEWAIDRAEVFASLSGGVALAHVDITRGGVRNRSRKNLWVGSVRAGVRYWFTDDLFIALDGVTLFSTSKRFAGVNTDLDGVALLLDIGLGF